MSSHPIQSDRYELAQVVNSKEPTFRKGCWGEVERYLDKYTTQDSKEKRHVAIKVLAPTDLAREQARKRGKDLATILYREGRFTGHPNLVLASVQEAKDGTPFVVMPWYDRTLADLLDARKGSLHMYEAMHLIEGILAGMHALHKKEHLIHGDIHERNILLDENNEPLIADCGSATIEESVKKFPHDNTGAKYTRSPRMFLEGSQPRESGDCFAAAALFYRMLTGEYPFQQELNANEEEFRELIKTKLTREEVTRITYSREIYSEEYLTLVERKLSRKEIPKEFRKTFFDVLTEGSCGAKDLLEKLKRDYEKDKGIVHKLEERKSWLQELKEAAAGGLGIGVLLSAIVTGYLWSSYLSPKPRMDALADIGSEVTYRDIEKCDFLLEAEQVYAFIDADKSNSSHLAEFQMKKYGDNKFLDKIVMAFCKTMKRYDGTGAIPRDYDARYHRSMFAGGLDADTFLNDVMRKFLQDTIPRAEIRTNIIDLEDALAMAQIGTQPVLDAVRATNNTNFRVYKDARKPDGTRIISPEEKDFLEQWIGRVIRECGTKVFLKSDLLQAEPIETVRANAR